VKEALFSNEYLHNLHFQSIYGQTRSSYHGASCRDLWTNDGGTSATGHGYSAELKADREYHDSLARSNDSTIRSCKRASDSSSGKGEVFLTSQVDLRRSAANM